MQVPQKNKRVRRERRRSKQESQAKLSFHFHHFDKIEKISAKPPKLIRLITPKRSEQNQSGDLPMNVFYQPTELPLTLVVIHPIA